MFPKSHLSLGHDAWLILAGNIHDVSFDLSVDGMNFFFVLMLHEILVVSHVVIARGLELPSEGLSADERAQIHLGVLV